MIEHLGGGGAFNNPYSLVVRAGDFLFVSGQVGLEGKTLLPGGVEAETRRTLERIREALALADCTLADVVRATVYLSNAADFSAYNKVYSEYFPANPPARSTVVAQMITGARIEIEATAYAPILGGPEAQSSR
jgi:reactive intermediate/imine deaminase